MPERREGGDAKNCTQTRVAWAAEASVEGRVCWALTRRRMGGGSYAPVTDIDRFLRIGNKAGGKERTEWRARVVRRKDEDAAAPSASGDADVYTEPARRLCFTAGWTVVGTKPGRPCKLRAELPLPHKSRVAAGMTACIAGRHRDRG